MSSTTADKATQTTAEKTKKRSPRKKVPKTSARKTAGSSTAVKKTASTKKAGNRNSATTTPVAGKPSRKAARSKKTALAQQQPSPAPVQTGPVTDNSPPADSNSLSWMSAQAASALKAVKASQAEKGQAVLARSRKQAAEQPIDDDSLMKIAAEMPVDNDALVEFSAEQPFEEYPGQADEALSTSIPVEDESRAIADTPDTSRVAPAAPAVATDDATTEVPAVSTDEAGPGPTNQPSPPQPARRSTGFQPALAAGLVLSALLLGYYFWPAGNDRPDLAATQESTEIEVPETATGPDPITGPPVMSVEAAVGVAATPEAEPRQQPAGNQTESTPPVTAPAGEPSGQPQAVVAAPVADPEPAPATAASSPPVARVTPAARAVPAPAQTGNRAPAQGYYPQQRRPTYPQQYYYR